jgi:hypothetical protein
LASLGCLAAAALIACDPLSDQPMTTQSRSLALAVQLSRQPYAWPGGYPQFGITDDGGTICQRCCITERLAIATTTGSDGWCIRGLAINWEDPFLFCDHCGSTIESAYGEV